MLRDAYGPGLRFGGMLGVRIGGHLSLNGELTYDVSNVSGPVTLEERFIRASVSPMIHLDAHGMELAVGPKIGRYSRSSRYNNGNANIDRTDSGYSTGLNAGAFVPVSPQMAIGFLLSFDVMWSLPNCAWIGINFLVQCNSGTNTAKVLGLTGALLF